MKLALCWLHMLAGAPVPSTENDLAAKYPPLDSTKEEGGVEAKEEVRFLSASLCTYLTYTSLFYRSGRA